MVRRALATMLALTLVLGVGVAWAQGTAWIHVRVVEDGGAGQKVSVNLPLSMVDVALDVLEKHERFDRGEILFDHDDEITVEDLRRAWKELRAAGDGEFVTVEDGGESVRVSRRAGKVLVEVHDDDGEESVRVEVPVEIVDALLGGEGDRLDVRAAVSVLTETTRGEIVSVRDGGTEVRVWIDETGS